MYVTLSNSEVGNKIIVVCISYSISYGWKYWCGTKFGSWQTTCRQILFHQHLIVVLKALGTYTLIVKCIFE